MANVDRTFYINVGQNADPRSALVYGINNNSPVSIPALVFGDTVFLTIYGVTGQGAISSISGDSNIAVRAAIGTPGTSVAAYSDNFLASGSAWTGSLSLNTLGIQQLLNSGSSVLTTFEVELTDNNELDAPRHTILQTSVRVYNQIVAPDVLFSGSFGDFLTVSESDARYWLRIETVDSSSHALTASYVEGGATPILDGDDYYFPYYVSDALVPNSILKATGSSNKTLAIGPNYIYNSYLDIGGLPLFTVPASHSRLTYTNATTFIDSPKVAALGVNGGLYLNYYSGENVIVNGNGGFLGVNVASPSAQLHVNGNAIISNITASRLQGTSSWADSASWSRNAETASVYLSVTESFTYYIESSSFASSSLTASVASESFFSLYALESGYSYNSGTASYVLNPAPTASYLSGSFVSLNGQSEYIYTSKPVDAAWGPSLQSTINIPEIADSNLESNSHIAAESFLNDNILTGSLRGEVGSYRSSLTIGNPFAPNASGHVSSSFRRLYSYRANSSVSTHGHVTELYGMLADTYFASRGSASYFAGGTYFVNNTGGGRVENLYGLQTIVRNVPGALGTGSIQRAFGIQIGEIEAPSGSIVDKFGIYQAGTEDKNYFAGPVYAPTFLSTNELPTGGFTPLDKDFMVYSDYSGSLRAGMALKQVSSSVDSLHLFRRVTSSVSAPLISFGGAVQNPILNTPISDSVHMVINQDGSVGIGTVNTDGYTLKVSGSVTADSFVGTFTAYTSSYTSSYLQITSSYAETSSVSLTSLTASYALNAGVSTHVEKQVISGSSFTGNPKIYVATYSQPFNSSIYVCSVVGQDARVWSVIPSTTGSIICSNSNQTIDGFVYCRFEEI